MVCGRIPQTFLPLQAGVGNLANGVMPTIGNTPEIPPFMMYSDVFQIERCMRQRRIRPKQLFIHICHVIHHDLFRCFELHRNLLEYGAMLPDMINFGG
jgi:acyl-CoA hydrolase